jgi:hypothetical protein
VSAGKIVANSRKVDEHTGSVAYGDLGSCLLAASPQERTPTLASEEIAHILSDQLASRDSENGCSGGISIQAVGIIVGNENPIEDILKDGREFAMRIVKGLVCILMLSADTPQRIARDEDGDTQGNEKSRREQSSNPQE